MIQDRFDKSHELTSEFAAEKSIAKVNFLMVDSQRLRASTQSQGANLKGALDLVVMFRALCHCEYVADPAEALVERFDIEPFSDFSAK